MNTYKKLLPQIRSIVKMLENFNNSYETEDYFQEAFVACLEANKMYKKAILSGRMKMQPEVFSLYRVKNHLFAMADTGEIAYEIYSPSGDYIKTMHNNEFRKTKKKLAEEGYSFRSVRLVESIYKEDTDGNETEMQIEGGLECGRDENDDDDLNRN